VLGIQKERAWPAVLCGLIVGLQFTVRPFTAVLVVAWLAMARLAIFRTKPGAVRQSLAFAAGLLPGIGLLLLHNWAVTGKLYSLAFSVHYPDDRPGFGLRGLGTYAVNHTLTRGLGNAVQTFGDFIRRVPLHYLTVAPVALWWLGRGLTRRRSDRGALTRWDPMLVLMMVVFLGGHVLYWAPRWVCYFDCLPVFWVLFARGTWYLIGSGRLLRIAACAVVLAAFSAVLYAPGHVVRAAREVAALQNAIDRAYEAEGPLLVFVRPVRGQLGHETVEESVMGMKGGWLLHRSFNNPLDRANAPILYAIDLGRRDKQLAQRYPNRRPRLLRARTVYEHDRLKAVEWTLLPLE
jgi:ABC-type amino acid transport system permease subunit